MIFGTLKSICSVDVLAFSSVVRNNLKKSENSKMLREKLARLCSWDSLSCGFS